MIKTETKKLYLPYYAFGKTSFRRISFLPVVELPLKIFSDFVNEVLYRYPPSLFTEEERDEYLYKLYSDYLNLLINKNSDILILGAADSTFYKLTKKFFEKDFDIITFVPLRNLEEEYWLRFRGRLSEHPGDNIPRDVFNKFWKKDHDFFEEESNNDPGIIFVRSGEYLSDYLDVRTGKLREEMLFR